MSSEKEKEGTAPKQLDVSEELMISWPQTYYLFQERSLFFFFFSLLMNFWEIH